MFKKDSESGFTLIEILVVIGIIAILAAIAIPVFLNQRKNSAKAAVESDLKNAAIVMHDEMTGNKGKFLPYVPNYDNRSEAVDVSLNRAMSSPNKFCLIGKSLTYPDLVFSYDSRQGGILPKGQSCTPPDGTAGNESYSSALATKKALIVYTYSGANDGPQMQTYLTTYGFGTVDIMNNPDPSVYADYDVIVASARAWSIPWSVYQNLLIGYENGAKIVTAGNDSGVAHLPNMIASSASRTGPAYFHQTGNTGLNPAFPYTFAETSFGHDGWVCTTAATEGTVIVATSPDPANANNKCLTALAINSNKSQWIHLTYMPISGQTGMSEAALNWLVY